MKMKNENRKLFWGTVKRLRAGNKRCPLQQVKNTRGEIVSKDEKIRETWRKYFEKLHSESSTTIGNDSIDTENWQRENNEDPIETNITSGEVKMAIKKLKLGKAAGIDGIYPEMIRNQGESADLLLEEIIKEAWNLKMVPKDWTKSIVIPIHKNGPTTECQNYRGISLLSVPGKVYARILEQRMRRIVEDQLDEHQSGFRPGRSVQDHIFTLRQINEKIIEYDKELHLCYIDLQKAFDSVQRQELWRALEKHDVNQELLEAIKSFYYNSQCQVRIAGKNSSSFTTRLGVRQGCILSPLLFIVFMNTLLIDCKTSMKKTCIGMRKLRPVYASLLSFADDVVILGTTEKALQENLNVINEYFKDKGMTINKKKTKSMVISKKHKKHEIKLENLEIEQVSNFKYLGAIITDDGRMKEELSIRINNAVKIYGQLGNIIVGKRELKPETKMVIYKTVYCPTLLYASESWVLNTNDKSRIQAAEMKYLRRIVGKTRRDRIRNITIREGLNSTPILDMVKRSQLRWFGHVNRMAEERVAKIIYQAKPQGKRPRGRPRKTWEEQIAEILRERGSSIGVERKKSLDRKYWKEFVQKRPLR